MDTIRELIIKEFLARAAVIRKVLSPASGYYSDIGAHVLRAQLRVDPAEEVPCTVVWPGVDEAEAIHGQSRIKMPVKVEGISFFGPEAIARGLAAVDEKASMVAERILGDLVKGFASPSWDRRRLVPGSSPASYLPAYADSIVYQGGGTEEYPEEGSSTVGVAARFLVTYCTALGDPYTQG